MSETISVGSIVTSCGGRGLAYFNQANDINRFLSTKRLTLSGTEYSKLFTSVWRGVCYVLSTRFIIQSIKGLPPLGIDLEKAPRSIGESISLLSENTPFLRRFPHLLNRDLPITGSVAEQYVTRDGPDGTVFPEVEAWVEREGFTAGRIYQRRGFPAGFSGGFQLALRMIDWTDYVQETHGFGLISVYNGNRGHCLVFHTGSSGEWMFMDVNYGWFLFPSRAHFANFLANYWFQTKYDFPTAYALDTFTRKGLQR